MVNQSQEREAMSRKKLRESVITVRSGLLTAVLGALGNIMTVLAIPVGPNIHINLYIIPAALMGSTNGWLHGALGGFIGSLYTPILWGWFGAIIYATGLGAVTGLLSTRVGLRPIIAGTLGAIIANAWGAPMQYYWLGTAMPVIYLAMFTTTLQMFVASVLTEVVIAVPAVKRSFPQTKIRAPKWVARSPILRHPWLEDAE
jgi:hypothetical protein